MLTKIVSFNHLTNFIKLYPSNIFYFFRIFEIPKTLHLSLLFIAFHSTAAFHRANLIEVSCSALIKNFYPPLKQFRRTPMSFESSQCASTVPNNRRVNTDPDRQCDGEEETKRAKLEPSPASNARRPRGPRGDRANESGSESDDEDTSGLLLKAPKPHATAAGAAPNAASQSSDASAAPKVVRAPMQGRVDLPRKVALLFMYYGVGYYGLQRNPNSRALPLRSNLVCIVYCTVVLQYNLYSFSYCTL